jgi:ubiquinone biosynthesis monooxygenase Coq6
VWDGVSGARITFDADLQDGASTIAYMCENNNLVSSLLSRIQELGDGIDILDKTRVEKIDFGTDTGSLDLRKWPVVTVSSGKQLAARLLVGADGANSPVRTFAEIETRGWDYGRHGVVATLNLESSQMGEKAAFQRFLPTGPVAMLPVRPSNPALVPAPMLTTTVARSLRKPRLVHDTAERRGPQIHDTHRFCRHG